MRKILALALALLFLAGCASVAEPVGADEYLPIATTEETTTTTEPLTTQPTLTLERPDVPQVFWGVSLGHNPSPAVYFALADINGDGVQELILACCCQQLVGLLTQQNGEAVRLAYGGWGHFGLHIAADGTVRRTRFSGGSSVWFANSNRLESFATELTQITDNAFSFVGYDTWHTNTQGERRIITRDEFDTL